MTPTPLFFGKDATQIWIELGERSYPIVIGKGILHQIGAMLHKLSISGKAMILSDQNVFGHYATQLSDALASQDFHVHMRQIGSQPGEVGEQLKSWHFLQETIEAVLAQHIDRSTCLIALGGGVIGDLIGVTSALTLRGVPYIQVPTSLLAQVDSSVGGKTGINSEHGKNLIGAFYQPQAVFIDIDTLATLPKREICAGYAEIVKYGALGNAAFFDWLEKNGQSLIAGDEEARLYAIKTSCQEKARIVAADETEKGARALLNLGHSFGHALEAACGYDGRLLHGEAVAIGMVMAFAASQRLGLCKKEDLTRLATHLQQVGLPVHVPDFVTSSHSPEDMVALMQHDKKRKGEKIGLILAHSLGKAFQSYDYPDDLLLTLWQEYWGYKN